MSAQGDKSPGLVEAELSARADAAPSGTRTRPTTSAGRAGHAEPAIVAPLTKLVSRIPPAPRIPHVEGMSLFASTATRDAEPAPDQAAPRKATRRSPKAKPLRATEKMQAWGAVVAAVLLGAIIVWASTH